MPKVIYIGANPRGNNRQRLTGYELHDQPGPQRIRRMWYPNNVGMLDSDVNAFPNYDTIPNVGGGEIGTTLTPGHTRIPKFIAHPPNTAGSNGLFSDDTLQVNSPSVGTPLN